VAVACLSFSVVVLRFCETIGTEADFHERHGGPVRGESGRQGCVCLRVDPKMLRRVHESDLSFEIDQAEAQRFGECPAAWFTVSGFSRHGASVGTATEVG